MEVWAELGLNGLEAKWHLLNGRGLVTLALGQAGHPSISHYGQRSCSFTGRSSGQYAPEMV